MQRALGLFKYIIPFFYLKNRTAEKVGGDLFGDGDNIMNCVLFVKFVNLLETVG